jgi:hypothetical protein
MGQQAALGVIKGEAGFVAGGLDTKYDHGSCLEVSGILVDAYCNG